MLGGETVINAISSLQVVEMDRICLHEEHESKRLHHTCSALCREGVLNHPPMAKRMKDGRYLILDGAHRTEAMREIGCRWLPVQLVDETEFQLEAWDHIVPAGTWLYGLLNDSSLSWASEMRDSRQVAEVVYLNGKRLYLYPRENQDGLVERLRVWHRLVGGYSSKYAVQRIASGREVSLEEGTVCLRYPVHTMEEIEEIVASGQLMPAGVTRFSIRGRLLNLRIPISIMKNAIFDHQEWADYVRHWEGALRLYTEAVYLCEKEYARVKQN